MLLSLVSANHHLVFKPFLLFDLLCGSRPRPRRPWAHPIAVVMMCPAITMTHTMIPALFLPLFPPSLHLRLSMILASPPPLLPLVSS